jgi:hypothetical protein
MENHTQVPVSTQSLAGDSGAVREHEVGPASSIKEIVEFGKRAYGRFGDATREGFYCIIDTIKALWWLRVGHQLGGDGYARAAKRMGVSRSTAFRIVHLYRHLDEIVKWAEDTDCVLRQRRLTPTWPLVAELLRRFPRTKGGSRRRSPVLERLHAANLELTDKVNTLTNELAAAKEREALLRRTINEQSAEIERLEKERAPAPRGRRSDDEGYILMPPDLHDRLHAEFGEMDDACPHPRPRGFDSLTKDWEPVTYVKAPFNQATEFVHKGIEQMTQGKTSLFVLPVPSYVNLLLNAGADVRPLGRIAWLHAKTGEPWKSPLHCALFVLRDGRCSTRDDTPEGIKFARVWAMPSARTFTIQPIKELLVRYEVGTGWLDPMAGDFSPAELTNDHHPERRARWHMDVLEFAKLAAEMRPEGYDGCLFDPPYSARQVSEHYKSLVGNATQVQTGRKFVSDARGELARLIKPGGHVISFGWNSNGFGKRLGFKVIEILLVQHGGLSHDTIITVERRDTTPIPTMIK